MADLTRFDFQALRFVQSDSVANMTNEEIGQYILLLCEAWLSQKNASLPDSLEVLSRKARCDKVSEKVLAQFPVVQTPWGPRRQNNTLFTEWQNTQERLDVARENGRKGAILKAAYRHLEAPLEGHLSEAQAKTRPDQTDSNQTKPEGSYDFRNIARQYSSYFSIHHSKGKRHIERYNKACDKYGEDRVLDCFERWAEASEWLCERHDTNGLNFFWGPLEDMVEGDKLRASREKKSAFPMGIVYK